LNAAEYPSRWSSQHRRSRRTAYLPWPGRRSPAGSCALCTRGQEKNSVIVFSYYCARPSRSPGSRVKPISHHQAHNRSVCRCSSRRASASLLRSRVGEADFVNDEVSRAHCVFWPCQGYRWWWQHERMLHALWCAKIASTSEIPKPGVSPGTSHKREQAARGPSRPRASQAGGDERQGNR
jgi:hypothetical protein